MFDAHIHVVPPNLPGVGPLSPGLRASVENVARVVREQMQAARMTHAAAMGMWEAGPDDPLGVSRTIEIARDVTGLFAIGVADPTRTDPDAPSAAEEQIRGGRVVALKAYLGYVHHFPNDPGYQPYYELAEHFNLPVFFHTGDTYSPYAKLKYAHPLEHRRGRGRFSEREVCLMPHWEPVDGGCRGGGLQEHQCLDRPVGLTCWQEADFTDEARADAAVAM